MPCPESQAHKDHWQRFTTVRSLVNCRNLNAVSDVSLAVVRAMEPAWRLGESIWCVQEHAFRWLIFNLILQWDSHWGMRECDDATRLISTSKVFN